MVDLRTSTRSKKNQRSLDEQDWSQAIVVYREPDVAAVDPTTAVSTAITDAHPPVARPGSGKRVATPVRRRATTRSAACSRSKGGPPSPLHAFAGPAAAPKCRRPTPQRTPRNPSPTLANEDSEGPPRPDRRRKVRGAATADSVSGEPSAAMAGNDDEAGPSVNVEEAALDNTDPITGS